MFLFAEQQTRDSGGPRRRAGRAQTRQAPDSQARVQEGRQRHGRQRLEH